MVKWPQKLSSPSRTVCVGSSLFPSPSLCAPCLNLQTRFETSNQAEISRPLVWFESNVPPSHGFKNPIDSNLQTLKPTTPLSLVNSTSKQPHLLICSGLYNRPFLAVSSLSHHSTIIRRIQGFEDSNPTRFQTPKHPKTALLVDLLGLVEEAFLGVSSGDFLLVACRPPPRYHHHTRRLFPNFSIKGYK